MLGKLASFTDLGKSGLKKTKQKLLSCQGRQDSEIEVSQYLFGIRQGTGKREAKQGENKMQTGRSLRR